MFEKTKTFMSNTKNAVSVSVASAGAVLMSTPAFAALDTSTLTVDDTAFYALAGIAVAAIIGVWMTKKGLAIFGR
jgi:hypothetical protein